MFLEIKSKKGVYISATVEREPTEVFRFLKKDFFLNLNTIKEIEFVQRDGSENYAYSHSYTLDLEKEKEVDGIIIFFEVQHNESHKPQGFTLLFTNDGMDQFERIKKAINNSSL
jgi:hypothetical protein